MRTFAIRVCGEVACSDHLVRHRGRSLHRPSRGDNGADAIFEAVHGTAPDITGKGLAHPLAAIFSGVMLLRQIGQPRVAARIGHAIDRGLREGKTRTRDLGGDATTAAVTDQLVALV